MNESSTLSRKLLCCCSKNFVKGANMAKPRRFLKDYSHVSAGPRLSLANSCLHWRCLPPQVRSVPVPAAERSSDVRCVSDSSDFFTGDVPHSRTFFFVLFSEYCMLLILLPKLKKDGIGWKRST